MTWGRELLEEARGLGFRAEEVAKIATAMGLEVPIVLINCARDFVHWKREALVEGMLRRPWESWRA